MLRLEIDNKPGTLEDVNPKTRKDAGGKTPCVELTLSVPMDREVLASFAPDLDEWLFAPDSIDLAGGVPLRDPNMVLPIERKEEMGGATLKLGVGVGKPITFTDVQTDSYRLTPVSGGIVIVGFRARMLYTEAQAGKLCFLLEQPVDVTLEPPETQERLA